jgi:hypothetical protein
MSPSKLRTLRQQLLERFVAGDIDKATYDQMLAELQALADPAPPAAPAAPPPSPPSAAVTPKRPLTSRSAPAEGRAVPPPVAAVTGKRPPASTNVPVARGAVPPPLAPVPAGRQFPLVPVLIASGFAALLIIVFVPLLILVVLFSRARQDSRDAEASREALVGAPKNLTPVAPDEPPPQPQPQPPVDSPAPPANKVADPQPPPEPDPGPIASPLAAPREGSLASAQQTILIDPVGNGQLTVEFALTQGFYTNLKSEIRNNKAVLLRKMGFRQHWSDFQEIQGGFGGEAFEDTDSRVCIKCTQPGRARIRQGDLWETSVGEALDLVSLDNNVAHFFGASVGTDLGLVTQTVHVKVPRGARDLKWLKEDARLTYRLPPNTAGEGNRAEGKFDCKVQPQVMTCLAKLYSNRKFPSLWTARAVLRNTGDKTLKNYRVHFRVPEFTKEWSRWERCEQVVAGQTVVDAYFPLFDLDRLAQLTDVRDTTLEVEYEYQKGDGGDFVHETESKQIKLLGRNQVIFSSMRSSDAVDFQDRYDYAPLFLASFVTANDRVIKKAAHMVSGAAGGGEFSLRDEEARKFLRALYDFLAANKVVYSTPEAEEFDRRPGQNVMYGREVFSDKAGTCIDLALCYASVCKAVGLKVKMFLIPGHCFPAIALPESHHLIAVETSGVGRYDYDAAERKGKEEVETARKGTSFYEVDIQAQHNAGVGSPDLPDLPEDSLEKWGYRVTEGGEKVPLADRKLEGIWRATYTIVPSGKQGTARMQFKDGKTFERSVTEQGMNGRTSKGTYTFSAKDGLLTLNYLSEKVVVTFDIQWESKDKIVTRVLKSTWPADEGQKLTFERKD